MGFGRLLRRAHNALAEGTDRLAQSSPPSVSQSEQEFEQSVREVRKMSQSCENRVNICDEDGLPESTTLQQSYRLGLLRSAAGCLASLRASSHQNLGNSPLSLLNHVKPYLRRERQISSCKPRSKQSSKTRIETRIAGTLPRSPKRSRDRRHSPPPSHDALRAATTDSSPPSSTQTLRSSTASSHQLAISIAT